MLFVGIFVCIGYALHYAGGVSDFPSERMAAFSTGTGLGDGADAPFLAFLVGGFFLYAGYYGTDQSQTQRELSAPTLEDTKRSLLLNGFGRAPLTGLYLVLGVAVGAAYLQLPELRALVEGSSPDYLVPYFVVHNLPTGVRAILVAAMLAAGMSSLDSALNSLSAATMRDFVQRFFPRSAKEQLRASKVVTVLWGIVITAFGFFVEDLADTVLEAVNKVGSAFNGPVLAAFILGVLTKRVTARPLIAGILVGVASNLALWILNVPVHFMWWNLIGFVCTSVIALLLSSASAPPPKEGLTLDAATIRANEKGWGLPYAALACYSVLISLIALYLGVVS